MATEAVDSNARFTPDPIANAGYLYLRPGVKRGEGYAQVEQKAQNRVLEYSDTGELLGVDFLDLRSVNIGLLPQDDVIPQEKDLVTLLESSGVMGIEGTTRDLFRDWISSQYTRVFKDGGIDGCVDFFGKIVAYPDGSLDEHIGYAFETLISEESKADFRGAVADVIAQRVVDTDPNLKEFRNLIWLAVETASTEASVPITNALINNPSLRNNKRITSDGYHAVFWFAIHRKNIDTHADVAREQAKRLIDSPEFDERYLPLGIKALLESDPFSVGEVLEEYRDRLVALKEDISQDELWVRGYRSSNTRIIEGLREKGIELTPEQLAILQV